MRIIRALTDAEKRSVNIRILVGLLGMIISFFLLMSFPDQVIFFEGGFLSVEASSYMGLLNISR